AEGGETFSMDGVWAYNEKAQFVGGKVINLSSYVVTELLSGEEQEKAIGELRKIIVMSAKLPMKTWGILNGIIGVYRMKQKGIFDQAAGPETQEELKRLFDWRTFIDCENHVALINLPTNYYGVAFGIARYRELLGWEPEGWSQKLLNRFMEHINQYSGEYEFMDETPGQGRFDRYSILVPAEIADSILNTGMELPDKIVSMLKKSTAICLNMANEQGYGFSYGRSTGAYGDTGVLQILRAAARVPGVLDQEGEKAAYAYCAKIIERFRSFWIDEEMNSINMWEKGRATDAYRNKGRILSENLSLCMQIVEAYDWKNPGCEPEYLEEFWKERKTARVQGIFYRFAKGEYERGLALVRDGEHVWSLPLISGGSKYYNKSPYLPIPYEQFLVTGVPDVSYGNLIPVLTLEDGRRVMPAVYMAEITHSQEPDCFRVTYKQSRMSVAGEEDTIDSFDEIWSETVCTWTPGQIRREDTFYIKEEVSVSSIDLEFLTFSDNHQMLSDGTGAEFLNGGISRIMAEGYESCSVEKAEDTERYHTPEGALKNHIRWEKRDVRGRKAVVSWTMGYHR
ncbi:MAG: hypothetical protein Q4F29_13120, partial [Lachnospiraceae bacterium]|nr:hypothetical protein [Lachnospiraceae bacterium]